MLQNPKSKIRNPKFKIQNPNKKNCYIMLQNPKAKIQNPKSEIKNRPKKFGFWTEPDFGWVRECTTRQFSDGASRSEAQIPSCPPWQPAWASFFLPALGKNSWTNLSWASLRFQHGKLQRRFEFLFVTCDLDSQDLTEAYTWMRGKKRDHSQNLPETYTWMRGKKQKKKHVAFQVFLWVELRSQKVQKHKRKKNTTWHSNLFSVGCSSWLGPPKNPHLHERQKMWEAKKQENHGSSPQPEPSSSSLRLNGTQIKKAQPEPFRHLYLTERQKEETMWRLKFFL